MEKLKKKTFYTIFSIISIFIICSVIIFNIYSYYKEYKGIKDSLTRIDNIIGREPLRRPSNNLNNKIIMDYNVYTYLLDRNNNIINKISHNEFQFSNNIDKKAIKILNKNYKNKIKINSLYLGSTSYNLNSGNYLVIVDTSNIRDKLLLLLFISIIILSLSEILICYVSKKITIWITKPVEETFNKQKDFIADASHELKTPLAVIMASTSCIEENKKNKKYINNIKFESDKMNELITKLLDLSKSENDNKELYALNNLSKIIEKRVLVFESLAFENNITFDLIIEKDIMLYCDNTQIDEVVSILLDNAIKHSYKNSKIKVKLFKEKNNIVLDVINKGDNIPEDELNKIFERFYRSDKSRNRSNNRYGLGLAIAKNIINNHDGQINVYSKDNLTTFKVTFINKKH